MFNVLAGAFSTGDCTEAAMFSWSEDVDFTLIT